jgi:hypothetical protein
MARGRRAERIVRERREDDRATRLQGAYRALVARREVEARRGEFWAAVAVQKVARRRQAGKVAARLALERRLASNFDDDYELIGRHSDHGKMRKQLGGFDIPRQPVFAGALPIGGAPFAVHVVAERSADTLSPSIKGWKKGGGKGGGGGGTNALLVARTLEVSAESRAPNRQRASDKKKKVFFCGESGQNLGLSGGDPPNPPCGRRGSGQTMRLLRSHVCLATQAG